MIFYFSATGNSKHVARRIAGELQDEILSITECMKRESYAFAPRENEPVGIITPTYFWGLPNIACDFLNRLNRTRYDARSKK